MCLNACKYRAYRYVSWMTALKEQRQPSLSYECFTLSSQRETHLHQGVQFKCLGAPARDAQVGLALKERFAGGRLIVCGVHVCAVCVINDHFLHLSQGNYQNVVDKQLMTNLTINKRRTLRLSNSQAQLIETTASL